MTNQPEALFLADVVENDPRSQAHHKAAAAELRRLHAENEALREEVQLLRLYGNKDCTAMADAAIDAAMKETK